ncbi:hypothetical protein CCP3SC1AL1_1140001 [Gammaproteobacteria bacterium]
MPITNSPILPIPLNKNTINSVSINLRDWLLRNNISSTYPSISTSVNGSPNVGQPVLDTESNHLNFYPHQQLDLNTTNSDILGSVLNGQGVGNGNGGSLIPNFDVRSSLAGRVLGATGLLNDTKIGTIGAQQLALALANNAAFNVEQSLLGALNVQDNVLALVKGAPLPGFRPSYQITIPSGTLGRVGDFAGKMLGFTIPRSYLGDDGSIFQPESGDVENIARANSMIKNTGKGQVLALLANARANLDVNSYETPFRSGYAPGFTNNKGVLQITDSNLYAYTDKEGKFINLLGISDGIIPNLTFNGEEKTKNSGFLSPEDLSVSPNPKGGFGGYDDRVISSIPFSWTTSSGGMVNSVPYPDEIIGDKKSLLVKTQKLFNSIGMKNIVSTKGDMNKKSTQISQANGGGFSKGNAVMKGSLFVNGRYSGGTHTAEETYCRSWTTLDRYDTISKLVRSGTGDGESINGIYGNDKVNYRNTIGSNIGSILDKYGNPQITPFTKDYTKGDTTDPKRYMFSIENLAWADNIGDLPLAEIGSGDLINGKKGRIMWFPPYDINFSESNNVNWESTNFIGRGEPVYTYNNTERAGNLSFKVVVDHPSYANSFRSGKNKVDDHYVNSFWAGCIPPDINLLTTTEKDTVEKLEIRTPQKVTPKNEPKPDINLKVYFPNDNTDLPEKYENGLSGTSITERINYDVSKDGQGYGIDNYPARFTPGIHQKTGWQDNTNYGLNGNSYYSTPINFNGVDYWGWQDRSTLLVEVEKHLKEKCPNCICEVRGFASQQGISKSNKDLVLGRAEVLVTELKKYLFLFLPKEERDSRFKRLKGEIPNNPDCKPGDEIAIDKKPCKTDRRAEVTFKFSNELVAEATPLPDIIEEYGKMTFNTKITDRFYNETLYFDQLTDFDPFVFDSFREKIKYFHPGFHSTTPEGLNSRLNFLLQCTRQGPTYESQGPNNLAFGRPPVCILRIGDFYNTKIIMDNVNIDYEPLVWDLNPEGIGVQPMIANVTISFKFIGGSSLMGPINKLQNALSFNYFANTQVYDARADYISMNKPYSKKWDDASQTFVDANADSLSGYYLNNGDPCYINRTEEKTLTNYQLYPPNIDEELTQEKNLLGVEVAPTPLTVSAGTIDDKAVISKIGFVGFGTYAFDNPILSLVFNFSPNNEIKTFNLDATAAKTYKGQIYVKNEDNKIMTNLGYISVRSNGVDNGVLFGAVIGEEIIVSPDINSALNWSVVLDLNDTQNEIVAKAIKLPNSSLLIEWETKYTNNRSFAESAGL